MAISRKFSIAESNVDATSDVSVAVGLGSYEISNQGGGTLGLNSTTATTRRNEKSKEEDKK